MKQKYYLARTTEEWRLMIESLNNLRNRLISESKYTDAVDEVLIKVTNAETKKFKIAERRASVWKREYCGRRFRHLGGGRSGKYGGILFCGAFSEDPLRHGHQCRKVPV